MPSVYCELNANVLHCTTIRKQVIAMSTSPYSIRLDEDLRKTLEREAAIEDRPPAQLAVRAIRMMLESKAAKRAAIDAAVEKADQGKFITADEMNAWIDSWDTENELSAPVASGQSNSQ
ncbi:CopG family ribbon-helix-helix protein [Ruegeria arenilitoris]|uniref:CopG family ribbon-helix-helix protein n=1 Tax=Ruegeria arenilitoris TaxID=1173585 RepID=UPI00147E8ABF|nr:hypothetical protein [Ruegeria arenilitoris]